jgi:phosphatidylglycerol:prolipoprotein diacylglycerol transferase
LVLKWVYRKRYQFEGQVFLLYVMLYSLGRGVIEVFRGDEARGYLFDGLLSHSQFISTLLIIGALIVYLRRKRKSAA